MRIIGCDLHARQQTLAMLDTRLVWQLIAETSRQVRKRDSGPRRLDMVREILHAHFSNRPTLSELARLAAIHPSHLSRSFHARFGCTISNYVQQLCVDFAWQQLIKTDEPIVEIALRAGFAHQAHFSTAFKRQTGRTPAEVRNLRERPQGC